MKKGVAPEMLLAFTLVISFMILWALVSNLFLTTKTVDLEETQNTYVLVNALKTAKVYIESSLDLSVYQAAYNNSRHGGYADISQLPPGNKMGNVLITICEKEMERFQKCGTASGEQDKKIHTDLKKNDHDLRPVGLLQCILARMRDKNTGEIYYGLSSYDRQKVRQIDCDFGEVTEKGLRDFQEDQVLTVNGKVDDATLQRLKEVFMTQWGDCGQFFDGCEDKNRTLVFWEIYGAGTTPNEQKILDELKSSLKNEMAKYTKNDYGFMDEYVKLPNYGDGDIKIERSPDSNFLKINLTNQDMVSVTEENMVTMERINMRLSPNITKEYPIRYFDFYDMGKEAFQNVKKVIAEANKDCASYIPGDEIMHNSLLSGFAVDAEVFDILETPACSLILKVAIKDETKTFPVFTGKEVSFEPIAFEFLVKAS